MNALSNGLSNLFDNISRIGSDDCDKTNKQISNTKSANYILENFSNYNSFSSALNVANEHPNVFIQGSPSGGINSSVIDDSSKLNNREFSRSSIRGDGTQRIFKTTPYLGKGPYDVDSDIQISNNELNTNRKTQNPNTEITQDNYTYTPLIPAIETTVTNPSNLVEGVAYDGWVRGGVPSRLLNRVEDEK
jgi:hypothetical protein